MLLKDISFATPEENIIYDEVLLKLAEAGKQDEVLRFWEASSYFIVLGRTSKSEDDVMFDKIKKDKISLLRRLSGGGTVLQGKGCCNYSLIISKTSDALLCDIRKSYQVILKKVILVFKELGIPVVFKPTSDLALGKNEKKFSGNAQRRRKNFILHHGTILYDFDLSLIERYLKVPTKMPEYRKGRAHKDFVANVPVNKKDIKNAVCRVFAVENKNNELISSEKKCLREMLAQKDIIEKIV